MSDPWLTLIGVGEDGLEGLRAASLSALAHADTVFGAPRHLALARVGPRGQPWPVPFSVEPVLARRGLPTVVLTSGDPFWHGAGGSLVPHLAPGEWVSHPGLSTFALAANHLGWRLEDTICLGLHAASLARLRPLLGADQRLILLMRDGAAVAALGAYLADLGLADSLLHVMESLGGPHQKVTSIAAHNTVNTSFSAPVAVALHCMGRGLPRASGLPDALFDHDGQITKRPVRALTLSALAPRVNDILWDIGTGSGSVSIEVLLAAPGSRSFALEVDGARAARARRNAASFGLEHRMTVTEARAPEGLAGLPAPDLVFIGGGGSSAVLTDVWDRIAQGARLVMNAVTIETEALLYEAQARLGGTLLRIDLAEMDRLGSRRGWQPARPVVQWSVQK